MWWYGRWRSHVWALATAWTVPQAAAPQTAGPSAARRGVRLPSRAAAAHAAVVKEYCATCHNERLKQADLSLEGCQSRQCGIQRGALGEGGAQAGAWRDAAQGVRRPPTQPALEALTGWLEGRARPRRPGAPESGRPLLHRLNRAGVRNAIRDLLGLDLDVSSLLPPDDSAYGFDNIADVLGVSPVLLERYLRRPGRQRARGRRSGRDAPASRRIAAAGPSQDVTSKGCRSARVGGAGR